MATRNEVHERDPFHLKPLTDPMNRHPGAGGCREWSLILSPQNFELSFPAEAGMTVFNFVVNRSSRFATASCAGTTFIGSAKAATVILAALSADNPAGPAVRL
jgi:hypothetical protein